MDWPDNGTDAAWLFRGGSIPQALVPELTDPTMAHPSGIEDAYAPITFRPPFLCIKGLPSRAAQGAIGLWSKRISGKPAHLGGSCPLRRSVGHRSRFVGNRLRKRRGSGGSKFGCAHGSRMEAVPQFKAEIPHPLSDVLPDFLPTGRA